MKFFIVWKGACNMKQSDRVNSVLLNNISGKLLLKTQKSGVFLTFVAS